MEMNTIIEWFGELTKEEPVSSLTNDLILPETVVLEAVSPFFGYYDDAPLSEKQPYVYLVLDECHSLNRVIRAVVNIRKQLKYTLTADLGTVSLSNQSLPVIRIKDIQLYCRLGHIQKCFQAEGIRFKKSNKKVDREMALINMQKFLLLEPAGDGLYLDKSDPNKGYFTIPVYLEWDHFKALTIEAKYETSILYFDAAQAVVFENSRVVDMVRIYREHLAIEKLSAIRDRYLKVLG